MAKREKEKCRHGGTPVYMQGCFSCCDIAMTALQIANGEGLNRQELCRLLANAFPTKEVFDAAVAQAKKDVAEKTKPQVLPAERVGGVN